jgi:hypothetical protein
MNQNNNSTDSTNFFAAFAFTFTATMGVTSFVIGREHYLSKNRALSYIKPVLKRSGFLWNEYNDYSYYNGYYQACTKTVDYIIKSVPKIIEKTTENIIKPEGSNFDIPIYGSAAEAIGQFLTDESDVKKFITTNLENPILVSAGIAFNQKIISAVAPFIVQNIEASKAMTEAFYNAQFYAIASSAIAIFPLSDQTLANISCNLTGLLCIEPATNSEYNQQ